MAAIIPFTTQEKTAHNSHKFAFTLNPKNYGYWKAMIEPFLIANNLFGYIDGTIPCPQEKVTTENATTDNPSYRGWIANDAHVRMILVSTVSEASFQHVQGTTSRDIWLALERAYAPSTSSHEFTLKTQLLKIAMKGDEKPIDYLSRAQEYATALANIGEPMKDKDLVMLTIAGLREEYNGLKSNLLARSPPVAFNELHGLLSDHDYMLNRLNTVSVTANLSSQLLAAAATAPVTPPAGLESIQQQLKTLQLMAAQIGYQLHPAAQTQQAATASVSQPQAYLSPRSNNNNRNNRGNRGNYRGNTRSNRGREQQGTRQFSWASTQNMVYGHCNRCGIGHIPSQCPNQSSNGRAQANYAASDVGSYSTWNPDTGANHHGTPDLSSLDNSEAYYGRVYTSYPPQGSK
ncbi:putative transcription factor interactor and regulator CCHC(Zn) family [Helianthus annuus]|nr:putative transcription factor interactor and regulator CCHC(Zn) family [Helianthus annuus]